MVLFALLASLPMLRREETPGIGMEELLSSAEAYLSAKKAGLFKALSLSAEETSAFPAKSLAAKYVKWEGSLRNAIARQRAARLGLDPAAYLRDFSYDTEADRFVRDAFAAENPLEREKLLEEDAAKKAEGIANRYANQGLGLQVNASEEIKKLTEAYTQGKMKREEYEAEVLKVQQKYARQSIDLAMQSVEEQLNVANLSPEDRARLEEELSRLLIQLSDEETQVMLENDRKQKESIEKKQQAVMDYMSKASEALNAINGLANAIFEGRIQQIEDEQEANEEAGEKEQERIEELEASGVLTKEQAEARKRATDSDYERETRQREERERKRQEREERRLRRRGERLLRQFATVGDPNALLREDFDVKRLGHGQRRVREWLMAQQSAKEVTLRADGMITLLKQNTENLKYIRDDLKRLLTQA